MALVEVYGGQLEELSFQTNHRYTIKWKYLIGALGATCVKYRQYWQSGGAGGGVGGRGYSPPLL